MVGEAEDTGRRGTLPYVSPALAENRHRSWGSRGWGRDQQSLVSFSEDIVLFALHVLEVKG